MTNNQNRHYLPQDLLQREVKVIVVGAGGTGSHIVSDLAVLHQSMLDLGHPHGLCVTVVDYDTVSSANVGRARFYEADVGRNKATVLVNRINICYGLNFIAQPKKVNDAFNFNGADIVIGCVDTRASRRVIWNCAKSYSRGYWLDIGNGADDGQVILGQFPNANRFKRESDCFQRLPAVVELFPEMLNRKYDPVDSGPSCSRADALRKQSAFVNKTAALHAISMLASLFRDGFIEHHAVFFNCRTGKSNTLACDPAAWKRFGYSCEDINKLKAA